LAQGKHAAIQHGKFSRTDPRLHRTDRRQQPNARANKRARHTSSGTAAITRLAGEGTRSHPIKLEVDDSDTNELGSWVVVDLPSH
jgi:hypothetical protein